MDSQQSYTGSCSHCKTLLVHLDRQFYVLSISADPFLVFAVEPARIPKGNWIKFRIQCDLSFQCWRINLFGLHRFGKLSCCLSADGEAMKKLALGNAESAYTKNLIEVGSTFWLLDVAASYAFVVHISICISWINWTILLCFLCRTENVGLFGSKFQLCVVHIILSFCQLLKKKKINSWSIEAQLEPV